MVAQPRPFPGMGEGGMSRSFGDDRFGKGNPVDFLIGLADPVESPGASDSFLRLHSVPGGMKA